MRALNKELKDKIKVMMEILNPDINPLNLSIGWIELYEENKIEEVFDFYPMYMYEDLEILKDYVVFLSEVDQFIAGAITMMAMDELKNIQFCVEEMEDDEWICIGKIIDEPIFININDGGVVWLQGLPEEEKTIKELGDFNYFMNNYVFGKKYTELYNGSEQSNWYKKLKEAKLV